MSQTASLPAAVTRECLQSFFNHLDAAHLSRVRLADLKAFTTRHAVTFSLSSEALAAIVQPGQMPPSTAEQHERIVGQMFEEALSLRAPTMFAKATQQSTGMGEPTLVLADLASVLRVRPNLVQSSRCSKQYAVTQTQFREQWIQLLLCVEPNPFDPSSRDSTAEKDGYLSFRAQTDRSNLPRSMYEREAAHASAVQTARARRRKNAPGSGPFHPSITLPSAPPARSAGSCYEFAQPRIRSVQLSPQYLAERAAKAEAARAQEEREWNPRVRQQKMLERTLQAHAQAFQRTQNAAADSTPQPSDSSDAREADVNSPSFYRDDDEDSSAGPLASGEELDAQSLQRITFRTQHAWKGRTEAIKDKSEALEFKQDASAALAPDSSEAPEDLLAKALFASQAGSSQTLSPQKPQGTTAERVAKALAAQRISFATSGKFKAPAASAAAAAEHAAGTVRLADGSLRPRWLNADAPVDAAAAARGSSQSSRTPAAPAVQFDDQGRPIRVHTRRALTERLLAPQGQVALTAERRSNDGAQAFELAVHTERFLQELPLPDPLDTLLAPFVVPPALPNPVRALERALEVTPSTAANSRRDAAAAVSTAASIPGAAVTARPGSAHARTARPRTATRSARSSVGATPQTARAATATDPAAATSTARSSASISTSARPPFLLDFPRRSPQDERREASRSLTCFGSPAGASSDDDAGMEPPSIANGGITKLAQLRRGYAPSLQAQLNGQLDRDASLGDLSLLPRGSAELSMLLARQKLDASRPAFRLDFQDARERGLSANVITRDGGATTAAELEAWRLAQLGFPLKAGMELSASTHAARLGHTRGVVVHSGHLAPGSHRAKHPRPFSALLGVGEHDSPLDQNRVAGLQASEREARRREQQMLAAPVSAADARRARAAAVDSSPQSLDALRAALAQKMRPSERRKVDEAAKQAEARQQFPFQKIRYEEAKSQS